MRWLRFIFSHSIFISICAVALCFQTSILLQRSPDHLIYLLVFSSTLCSYNFYWLLSKFRFVKRFDIKSFVSVNIGNIVLSISSAIAILYCVFKIPGVLPYLLAGSFLTFLYSLPLWPGKFIAAITRVGFIKTILLALTWTFVTIILPVYDQVILNESFVLLFIARFSFMLMLCAIFDSRDISVDQINGLRSLATDVPPKVLQWIIISLLIIFIIAGILLRLHVGSDQQLISFIISGLTVLLVYIFSRKPQGYFFYYFCVDGLMLFSAATTYIANII